MARNIEASHTYRFFRPGPWLSQWENPLPTVLGQWNPVVLQVSN